MGKQKFYSLKAILQRNADYNLIFGERSNGKSYAVKKHVLEKFRDNKRKFVYLRRYDRDITAALATAYFADMPISDIFNGEYNTIYVHGGNVYLAIIDEDGNKRNAIQCGYVRALNLAQRYSSTAYPDVDDIILEEFISLDGGYLTNEIFLFLHIVSTIARRRNVTVWLIANSISRICPYWLEFGVAEIIKTLKQGQIAEVNRETENDIQKIAIEYCSNSGGASKMFDKKSGEMTNSGKWYTRKSPRVGMDIKECECLYLFVVQYKNYNFMVQYMVYKDNYFLYVTPKTSEIKSDTRIITDRCSINPLATRGVIPLTARERLIFEMLNNGKTFFSDDQTGTDFQDCMKNLRDINYQ